MKDLQSIRDSFASQGLTTVWNDHSQILSVVETDEQLQFESFHGTEFLQGVNH